MNDTKPQEIARVAGIPVVLNPQTPRDVVELRQGDQVVATINVGPTRAQVKALRDRSAGVRSEYGRGWDAAFDAVLGLYPQEPTR